MSEIVSGLFVGDERHAMAHGAAYDLVVNCTPRGPFPEGFGGKRVRVPILDDPDDSMRLFETLRDTAVLGDIHEALRRGERVLVHCQAGVQRSPAVAGCYLIEHHGLTVDQAVAALRARRKIAFFWQANLRGAMELLHRHVAARAV